jgi:hypothetical protein
MHVTPFDALARSLPTLAPPPVTCAPGRHNYGTYCVNVTQDAAIRGICGWDCASRTGIRMPPSSSTSSVVRPRSG